MINAEDRKYCCGCNACLFICPIGAMRPVITSKGFYEAEIDSKKCINCGLCDEVCPIITQDKKNVLEAYAVQSNRLSIRTSSRSGGAFSVFAKKMLSDGGVVYGVAMDGFIARYTRIEELQDLERLKGSKYVQAYAGDAIKKVECDLKSGRKVLFSGTPCMVQGVVNYCKKMEFNEDLLVTVDLVCHGVPSPMVFQDYINHITDIDNILSYDFRDKVFGWEEHICSYKTSEGIFFDRNYVNIFYSDNCLHECCYICKFSRMSRPGDITLGDFWGIQNFQPDMSDSLGTSLVMINSNKGNTILRESEKYLKVVLVNKEKYFQPNLEHPSYKPKECERFWEDYFTYGYNEAMRNICVGNTTDSTEKKIICWESYRHCVNYVKKIKYGTIYLYGIGNAMFQFISYINNYEKSFEVKGVLDHKYRNPHDSVFGLPIIEEKELVDGEGIVIICTKRKETSSIIKTRLENNIKYRDFRLVSFYDFLKL